jgi:hypothetical protein
MTDHPLISHLASAGTASAYDLAKLSGQPLGTVVATLRDDLWWEAQQIAGPKGWLYRVRSHVSVNARMPKEVGIYNDGGISPSGPRGFIK